MNKKLAGALLKFQRNFLSLDTPTLVPFKEKRLPVIKLAPYSHDYWEVLEAFHIKETVEIPVKKFDFKGKKYKKKFDFYVPAGFVYDLASIPRFFLRVTKGRHRPVYAVPTAAHDFGLRHSDVANGGTRREVDFLFNHMMKKYDVEGRLRKIMFAAVRVGSKKGWRLYRKLEEKLEKESK